MNPEHVELGLQKNSNSMFDKLVNKIEEDPQKASALILFLFGALGITNLVQKIKNRKEQKRHEEVENLHKDALQKHDAQIREYKDLCEENERLKKLNSSLCDALVETSEGGEPAHEG